MPAPDSYTILITGAGSGLGHGLSLYFAATGHRGLATDKCAESVKATATEAGANVTDFELDVSSHAQIAAFGDSLGGRRVEVLVNNAGRHDFRRTTEVTEAEWEHDLALNLSGPFYCAQSAIPHLLEAPDGGGTIVNVASVAGLMGEAYSAAYTAAKHGVVGLTKALAVEHLKQPLRVNCVCPGGMDTPQVQTIGVPDDADWDLIMRVAATRGLMSADNVAAAICFLASNDAAAVNGSIHAVDAGRTAG